MASGGGRFLGGKAAISLTIREPDELVLAIERIHDRWCDVDAMTYDPAPRALRDSFLKPIDPTRADEPIG